MTYSILIVLPGGGRLFAGQQEPAGIFDFARTAGPGLIPAAFFGELVTHPADAGVPVSIDRKAFTSRNTASAALHRPCRDK